MTARAGSGPADLPLRSPTALKSLKSLTVLTSLKSLKSLTVLTAALPNCWRSTRRSCAQPR